jgi:hypothetical protein
LEFLDTWLSDLLNLCRVGQVDEVTPGLQSESTWKDLLVVAQKS